MKSKVLRGVNVFQHQMSHWAGCLAEWPCRGEWGRITLKAFAALYKINLEEAEKPIDQYHSIGELFARRLKTGARPLQGQGVIHPADAVITQAGRVELDRLLQIKGQSYSLCELLGGSEGEGEGEGAKSVEGDSETSTNWARSLEGGSYLTYYLCPTDYHRVHVPFSGQVQWVKWLGSELWPVHNLSVSQIPNLFIRNERVVVAMETEHGRMVVVLVGALNVGSIELCWNGMTKERFHKNRNAGENICAGELKSVQLQRGDELGIFHLGSTVILICEDKLLKADTAGCWIGKRTRVGEAISTDIV